MNKFKLFTLLVLLSSTAFSQYTSNKSLDSLLFAKINDYRVYNNVHAIRWDDNVYKMSTHHTEYQILSKTVGHRELKDVDKFDEINTLKERYEHYVSTSKTKECSENARGGNSVVLLLDTVKFGKFVKTIWNESVTTLTSEEVMVLYTVFRWKESPSHNVNMLSTFCSMGSVSIMYYDLKYIEKSLFHSGNSTVLFTSYSTMNFGKVN